MSELRGNGDGDGNAAPERRKRIPLLSALPRLPQIAWRDLAVTLGPVLLLSALAVALTLHFVQPSPPRRLAIAAGPAGSYFQLAAQGYRKVLARSGVELQIVTTEGSQDNLHRMLAPNPKVDVAFVQGGVEPNEGDASELVSLGSVFYQPLTVFYRADQPIRQLSELAGKHIGIGAVGSGTHFLALAMLKANGIEYQKGSSTLLPIENDAATQAFLEHKLDAVFLSGESVALSNIRKLMHAEGDGVRLYDFPQADAYVQRFAYLSKLQLPAGAFDLGNNIPPQPLTLLAPTVELIARSDLHPALVDLLIEASSQAPRNAMFQKPGEFPAPSQHGYPLSDEADRYYKSGKGLVYRYLPFWLASLVNRLLVILVPALVVLLPGLQLVPRLYAWRVKRRIYRRYGELMALERLSTQSPSPEQRDAMLERLAEIERSTIAAKMPGTFASDVYILRQHIDFVRTQLTKTLS
ncbi:MAG: ABC transporter substrate-binding protein [Rudaea sp.]|nr:MULTISPECIES: TAXI family TRAP transporter solute-binding subunit [unclassified Rudaea]MBN8886914.1 ABC transporter substrate-binding protein [Rudaea sp.]MBR0347700.1 ABC transporter substrate-binding protein [Rudaea sp.]